MITFNFYAMATFAENEILLEPQRLFEFLKNPVYASHYANLPILRQNGPKNMTSAPEVEITSGAFPSAIFQEYIKYLPLFSPIAVYKIAEM